MTRTKTSSVTIRDVARQANVSVATVSRHLSGKAPVSLAVAARLDAVIAELHYVPHSTARKLATHRTFTIGVLFTSMHGDFFAPLLDGVEAVTRQAGYDLLISSSPRPNARADVPPPLGPHNTDGLLAFAGSLNPEALRSLHAQGFPLVLIHQSPPPGSAIPCVTVENRLASQRIVEHLIQDHGRQRIAFLAGPAAEEDSRWRALGYQRALRAHDIPADPRLVLPGEFDREVAQASVSELLESGVPFDAIFTGDDEAAVGAYQALQAAGRSIPEQVAVVGFDDQRLAAVLSPPLTTVHAPTEEVGHIAGEQLIRRIETGQAELLTLLPTELVLRRSCGCPG